MALFRDREEAGEKLAEKLEEYRGEDTIILGIPRGGVAVGRPIADILESPLDIVVVRKLPIPWSPEAGFGAVTSTGDVVLNEEMTDGLDLTQKEIDDIASEVYSEVKRRVERYRGERPAPDLSGKTVIIADDGLATGYTAIAAVKAVKRYNPKKVIVAAPVGPVDAVERTKKHADEVVTLWSERVYSFAVASFYEDFHDMLDSEVTKILEEKRK